MKAARRPLARSHRLWRRLFLGRGFLGFLAALAAFGVFAAIVWVAYEEDRLSGTQPVVPVVRAAPGPIKLRPETPGGMKVPFQDKLVYDQLSQAENKKEKTRLLLPPEEPVARPKARAGTPSAQAPAKTEVLRLLEETPQVTLAKPVEKTTPVAPAPAVTVKAKPAAVAKAAPKVAAAIPPAKAATGVRVQIAAMGSDQKAHKQWARLQKAHGDLLGGLGLHVQRVDLGAKGIFFRLQAGPLAGIAAAKALCAKLKQRKIGCLIVRP